MGFPCKNHNNSKFLQSICLQYMPRQPVFLPLFAFFSSSIISLSSHPNTLFDFCPRAPNHSCSKTHVGVASSILGSQLGKKRRDVIKTNTRGSCLGGDLSLLEPTM